MLAYLGLGSNQGDRRQVLAAAVRGIRRWPQVTTLQVSSLYETDYVGPGRQSAYLNACLRLETAVAAEQLLALGQGLERDAGRASGTHLQPRPLDVDLLLYGELRLRTDELVLPHPRLAQRRFVLEPLIELGVLEIPGCDQPAFVLLQSRRIQRQRVERVEDQRWWEGEAA